MWQRCVGVFTLLVGSLWLLTAASAGVVLSGHTPELPGEIDADPKVVFACLIVAILCVLTRRSPTPQ
jgi:hypothetical protein